MKTNHSWSHYLSPRDKELARQLFLCDPCPWGVNLMRESKIHWSICLTSFRGGSAPRATKPVAYQLIVTKALMSQTQDTHAFSRRNQPVPIPHAWLCIPALSVDRPSFFITTFHERTRFRGVGPCGGSTLPSFQSPISVVGKRGKRCLRE